MIRLHFLVIEKREDNDSWQECVWKSPISNHIEEFSLNYRSVVMHFIPPYILNAIVGFLR